MLSLNNIANISSITRDDVCIAVAFFLRVILLFIFFETVSVNRMPENVNLRALKD
jgi:hypothetical protein